MFYIWISLIFLLDFFTKSLAESNLIESAIPIIWDFFSLAYTTNTGIAFGIGIPGIEVITPLLIVGIIAYYYGYEQEKGSLLLDMGYASIIGWAIGNAWERMAYGYVVDFISIKHFSVFNIADIAITAGVALILYQAFLVYTKEKNEKQKI